VQVVADDRVTIPGCIIACVSKWGCLKVGVSKWVCHKVGVSKWVCLSESIINAAFNTNGCLCFIR